MSRSKQDKNTPVADDIWIKLDRDVNNPKEASNMSIEQTSSLVYIGDYQCGKSTLISTFQKPTGISKDLKATIALEYSFARKTTNNVKYVANFWEVGGDLIEPKLIEIGIPLKYLGSAAIIIVVDLSKPNNVLNSLLRSISAVKEIVNKKVSELQATNVNLLTDIREKLNLPYKGHVDINRIRLIDVPLCIVANKHDLFKSTVSSSNRRAMIQVLRFVAHFFGAHLITTSLSDTTMRESYRTIVNSLAFGTSMKPICEVSNPADRLVCITRGADSFKNILLGHNIGINESEIDSKNKGLVSNESEMEKYITQKGVTRDCWGKISEYMAGIFGEADPLPEMNKSSSNSSSAAPNTINKGEGKEIDNGDQEEELQNPYPEFEIDEMRAIRDNALARFVQESERREEMNAKMNSRQ